MFARTLTIAAPLLLAVATTFACSSSTAYAPAPAPVTDASSVTEGESEETDAGGTGSKRDGGATKDAKPAGETETISIVSISGGTCDAKCAKEGYTCKPACEYQSSSTPVAGQAEYPESFLGQVLAGDLKPITTCDEAIEEKISLSGEPRDLSRVLCCCERPKVYVEKGDPKKPATCDSICEAKGLVCSDTSFLDSTTGKGQGASLTYGSSHVLGPCADVPATTLRGKALTEISCGCVAP